VQVAQVQGETFDSIKVKADPLVAERLTNSQMNMFEALTEEATQGSPTIPSKFS